MQVDINLFVIFWGGEADLVACWLVWCFFKAQAEKVTGNTGDQGYKGEKGDGMHWTCDSAENQVKSNKKDINKAFDSYGNFKNKDIAEAKYLIWAQRRRAARTCRGWEPRWPGWWLLCGFAGWVWWGCMHNRCCICQPCASGSHRADLDRHSKTKIHWMISSCR